MKDQKEIVKKLKDLLQEHKRLEEEREGMKIEGAVLVLCWVLDIEPERVQREAEIEFYGIDLEILEAPTPELSHQPEMADKSRQTDFNRIVFKENTDMIRVNGDRVVFVSKDRYALKTTVSEKDITIVRDNEQS